MLELVSIPSCPHASDAAALLARTRNVHVRLDHASPPPTGFVRGIAALDVWSTTSRPLAPEQEARLSAWVARHDVELAVTDVESFGVDALVTDVFFPLLVRHGYCRNMSAFPMNVETFRRVLENPSVVLTTASRAGLPIAACILQPATRTRTRTEEYSAPERLERGLDIVAFAGAGEDTEAPFFDATLQMLESCGHAGVRVRHAPFVHRRSIASFARDVARADAIAWEEREPADWFSVRNDLFRDDEGALLVVKNGTSVEAVAIGDTDREPFSSAGRALRHLLPRGASWSTS